MLIASAKLTGKDMLLLLGLSRENIQRLLEGKPIDISQNSHGIAFPKNLKICIFAGENEAELRSMIAPFIGPDTVINQEKSM